MKIKIVLLFVSLIMILAGCGTKNEIESSENDSNLEQKEEIFIPSSTTGGGQGTPEESVDVFRD